MKFLRCMRYLVLMGIVSFFAARLLPPSWPDPERGMWRSFSFERQGRIYEKLKIRRWQNRIPDMSRILPRLIPAKKLAGRDMERLPLMIHETCVAELIHLLLCLGGLYCLHIWPGIGGAVVAILFALGNLPFILVQRYNRPRLKRLLRRCGQKQYGEELLCAH